VLDCLVLCGDGEVYMAAGSGRGYGRVCGAFGVAFVRRC
jgi:hypothetical protein